MTLDSKLTFSDHVETVNKTCRQRMHIMRQLRSFYVDPKLILIQYVSLIQSLLSYCATCYYPSLSVENRNILLSVANTAAKIIGLPTTPLSELTQRALSKKARAVVSDPAHPLYSNFELLPSERRYRTIKWKTNRYRYTFVPQAILSLNQ